MTWPAPSADQRSIPRILGGASSDVDGSVLVLCATCRSEVVWVTKENHAAIAGGKALPECFHCAQIDGLIRTTTFAISPQQEEMVKKAYGITREQIERLLKETMGPDAVIVFGEDAPWD